MHESERIKKFLPLIQNLYDTAREKLGFEPHVKISIIKNSKNMSEPLGKTAYYSPSEHKIALYTQGRHIKDILRSLSHELVHHNQNCRGDFDKSGETFQGYAQEDGHLREMEREAYERGNMIFRDWEDKLKEKGGQPLFTSTHYFKGMSFPSPIMEKGEKLMKNKVDESQLRGIIQGVLKEMFEEDLNEVEDNGTPEAFESEDEIEADAPVAAEEVGACETEAEADETAADETAAGESTGEEYQVKESFFPKTRSIRQKARYELNENLMKRWGYTNKEK